MFLDLSGTFDLSRELFHLKRLEVAQQHLFTSRFISFSAFCLKLFATRLSQSPITTQPAPTSKPDFEAWLKAEGERTHFSKAMRTGGSPPQLCLYTVSRI